MKRLWTSRAAAGAASVRAVSVRSLAAGLAVVVAGLAVLAVPALASTSITVIGGGCSGGGTTFCFTPESASATTGSAVTWTNQSSSNVGHTVTVCTTTACPGAPANTGSNSFNLTLAPANGSTAQFTFSSAGTYYYYCTIHGYAAMHGAVAVSALSTPPPATPPPSSGSLPTHNPTGVKGISTTAPGTGAGLGGVPMLLLPLGLLLILAGVAGRRKR